MDIASLRIKFTPLLKSVQRGSSKCCLEIVPEVSAIHNLDRIEWTLEDNLVEYKIPMTYKIILKKPKTNKESSEYLDKTYHSCVDLLSTYSMTNLDLGSGDIKRILSDNIVLRKITSDIEQCNIVLSNKVQKIESTKTTSVITLDVKTNSVLQELPEDSPSETHNQNYEPDLISIDEVIHDGSVDYFNDTNEVTDFDHAPLHFENETVHSKNGTVRFYTSSENETTLIPTAVSSKKIKTVDAVSRRSTFRYRQNPKHRLSLSLICSVNTYDNPCKETISNRRISCYNDYQTYEPRLKIKNNKITLPTSPPNDFTDNVTKTISVCSHKQLKQYSNRILPEVRIAQFIQVLEKEIFPLKLMLNEIKYKCSYLGLFWPENSEKKTILYKSAPNIKNGHKVVKSCKNPKNRVVYTVVFDDY